ncbi:Aste57867_7743 [Aphanomyces stellatus]|uniref:Aste57867_7743 protein n=1 Tax=Aphanomyces stellatus TaxID=120398 RepID=A0A485KIQ5_9STRA|nr:hypothetical protein As57867_007714 [Aphanomyces stellatus]VFT84643.1 Aste57867_7743 [Aphanomyces stellatus]
MKVYDKAKLSIRQGQTKYSTRPNEVFDRPNEVFDKAKRSIRQGQTKYSTRPNEVFDKAKRSIRQGQTKYSTRPNEVFDKAKRSIRQGQTKYSTRPNEVFDKAKYCIDEALGINRHDLKVQHVDTWDAMARAAGIAFMSNEPRDLWEAMFQESMAHQTTLFGPDHVTTLETVFHLGYYYIQCGAFDAGLPLVQACYDTYNRSFGDTPFEYFGGVVYHRAVPDAPKQIRRRGICAARLLRASMYRVWTRLRVLFMKND